MLKRVNVETVDCGELMDFFSQQNWCKYPTLTDFYALVEIAARLHHAQNSMLFQKYFKAVVTPFLDIDYLKVLFQSDYHFLAKNKYKSQILCRLANHRFAADLQYILNNSLTGIPYNSGFKVSEYRINPYYAAFIARIRKYFWHYPTNFLLGKWMHEFVTDQLTDISHSDSLVREVFKVQPMLETLATYDQHINREASWLKYTTPVQMKLILDIFC